jgi:deoxycytidylate deaminase
MWYAGPRFGKNKAGQGVIVARISWEQYAMKLAQIAALRSEDPYVQVGAVALRKDHSVASIGYNGAPSGVAIDWSSRDKRRPFVVHAEINALRYVKPYECELLVVTMSPCANCLTVIATYGIKKICYQEEYVDIFSTFEMAQIFGITMVKLEPERDSRQLRLSI